MFYGNTDGIVMRNEIRMNISQLIWTIIRNAFIENNDDLEITWKHNLNNNE